MPIDARLARFKFAVLIGGSAGAPAIRAGFHELSGLGGDASPHGVHRPRKLAGIGNVPDVSLRRGYVGDWQALHEWLRAEKEARRTRLRTVTIQLLSDERPHQVVQEWQLTNARPVKYTAATLDAQGSDVAIEELVLTSERIDIP